MKYILYITLILLYVIFINGKSNSLNGDRVLVILDKLEDKSSYSIFIKSLEERGYDLVIKEATDSSLEIIKYEESLYDHLIVLAAETEEYENDVDASEFINFINKGGNIIIAGNVNTGSSVQDFMYEFGNVVDEPGFNVIDNFRHNGTTPNILAIKKIENPIVMDELQAPVLYEGTAIKSSGKNPYGRPVLVGEASSYSWDNSKVTQLPMVTGKDTILVQSHQAINNARIIFTGSVKMFSNKFITSPVKVENKTYKKAGNLDFITNMTKWAFHEKKVLKVLSAKHHRINEQQRPEYYTIKDKVHYEIEISEYDDGVWKPFNATDIQLELIMLDPYIRVTLKQQPITNLESSTYAMDLMVPDHCGVFTFKVDYRRYGYTWVKESDVIAIHPLHYNEFPRFLVQGLPYYCGAFSMIAGFFLLTILALYHEDDKSKSISSSKKKTN